MYQIAHEANARGQGAVEAHSQAKTDAVFDAAAALLDAEPRRARPSSCCVRKGKARSTTVKFVTRHRGCYNPEVQHTSGGGKYLRPSQGERTLKLQRSAFAKPAQSRAASLRRGKAPSTGATLAPSACFCYYFV